MSWLRLPPRTLRWQLIAGIVLPIALFVAFDAWSTYRRALASINTAYDRSLLASARSIGELLQPVGRELKVEVPYAALEIFDAGNAGRMYYRVNGLKGEFLSGYADLPRYDRSPPQRATYAALVDFYDADYRGERVRMAALYQPVAGPELRGVALIQVAETQEIRERHARALLGETLLRHAVMITVVALVAAVVVARALRPLERLRDEVSRRDVRDLSALAPRELPAELQPVVAAINDLLGRLTRLVTHQREFVRDASHQLRTPLAVLKTQVQNGLRGDVPERETLRAMHGTIDRATRLANQMLALAKVEQVDLQDAPQALDWAELVREIALDLAPLVADKDLDFELAADAPAWVQGHAWMLRELARNLLHNAIRATPPGAGLAVRVEPGEPPRPARLRILDRGPGLTPAQRERLFVPFHTGHPNSGSGLGLVFCRQVCERLQGRLELLDREGGGLEARVSLDAIDPAAAVMDGPATRPPAPDTTARHADNHAP